MLDSAKERFDSGEPENARNRAAYALREAESLLYHEAVDLSTLLAPGIALSASKLLGQEEQSRVVRLVEGIVERGEQTASGLMARFHLGKNELHKGGNRGEYFLQAGNIRDFINHHNEQWVSVLSTLDEEVAGELILAASGAMTWFLDFDLALEVLSAHAETLGATAYVREHAAYLRALYLTRKHRNDPSVALEAFQDYLDAYPGGEWNGYAWVQLGLHYGVAEDYARMTEVLEWLIQAKPDTANARHAQAILDGYKSHSEEAVQAAVRQGSSMLCGPKALKHLFAELGKPDSLLSLLEHVAVGKNGTSLFDLRTAAAAHGVRLEGASLAELSEAALPFLMHTGEAHYLLVTEMEGGCVSLYDDDKFYEGVPTEALPSQGKYLTGLSLSADVHASARLSDLDLALVMGGSDDPPTQPGWTSNPNCITYMPESCPAEKSSAPGSGQYSGSARGISASPASAVPPAPHSQGMRSSTNGVSQAIPVTSAGGTEILFNSIALAQEVRAKELAVSTRGALELAFHRTYHNAQTQELEYYRGRDKPYKGILGNGWRHNGNAHIRASSEFGTIIYYNEQGTPSTFVRDNDLTTTNFYYYFDAHSIAADYQRGIVFYMDRNTGEFTAEYPSGKVYRFSEPTDDSYRYGRLAWIRNALESSSVQITYHYDDSAPYAPYGRLTKMSAPTSDDRNIVFEYEEDVYDEEDEYVVEFGRVSKVTLKEGSSTALKYVEFFYDGAGNLTKSREDGSESTSELYEYDSHFISPITYRWMSSFTDPEANEYTFELDTWNVIDDGYAPEWVITYPNGGTTTTTTDLQIVILVWIETTTVTTTDASSNVVAKTDLTAVWQKTPTIVSYYPDPASATNVDWSYQLDTNSTFSYAKPADQSNRQIYYEHNDIGRLTSITRPGSEETSWTYPSADSYQPETMTSPTGEETNYLYDSYGRLTMVIPPYGGISNAFEIEYDSYGQVTRRIDPAGESIYFAYDTRGNMTQTTNQLGKITTMAYDDFGRVTTVTAPGSRVTAYEYSNTGGCGSCGGGGSPGQLTKMTTPESQDYEYAYDNNGNMTLLTDPAAGETEYEYDAVNRVTKVTAVGGLITTMEYDARGLMTKVSAPGGEVTEYEYNYMGKATKVTSGGADIDYEIDNYGNVTKVTDGAAKEFGFFFDTNNRLTKATNGASKETHYSYDDSGRATKVAAGSSGTVDPVEYFYSATSGLLSKVQYTNGAVVRDAEYYYDARAQLTRVDDWLDDTNSDGHFFEYDDAGRMTRYRDFDDDLGGTRKKLDYEYNDNNEITKMTDYDGNITTYAYSASGRLSTLTAPGSKVWDFDYNSLGQRTQVTYPNGMKAVYAYDTSNRMTRMEYNDGAGSPVVLDGWEYTLADDGNIMKMGSLTSDQEWSYYYDGKNRLVDAVRRNNSGTPQHRERYVYDAGDNMLTKRLQVYDGSKTVQEDFTDGNYTASPAWTVGAGTWAVDTGGDYFLKNTGTVSDELRLTNTVDDMEVLGSYRIDASASTSDYVDFTVRYNGTAHSTSDRVHVRFHTDKMQLRERYDNVWSIADFTDVDTALDTWYRVHIRCVGTRLEVWREDAAGAMQLVGVLDGIQTTATTRTSLSTAGDIDANFDKLTYLFHKSAADSFSDDFSDNEYDLNPDWITSGSWSASSASLANTSSTGNHSASLAKSAADNQLKVSVNKTSGSGSLRLYTREIDSTHKVYVNITDTTLGINQQDGTTVTLDSASITTTTNTVYDYHIISDGERMEVWRGPAGGTTELLLETDALTVLSSDSIILESRSATAKYDNVQFLTADAETTTFAYNTANELTTMTDADGTTTYTYDDWGRTISKSRPKPTSGNYVATYEWRFGDKLRAYDTDFPGEADVNFNYDGLGKRRLKVNNPAAPTDADHTWYRWDAGWNMIGEYAAGTDTGTTWDIGAISRHYTTQPGGQRGLAMAHADGDPDSTAYNYYMHDHLGSPRTTYNQSKVVVARQEFSAYGVPMANPGQAMDIGYTGHKWEDEAKVFYAAYRYYDPYSSRWLSRDPLGMIDGPNVYSYVMGNPAVNVDILGLFPCTDCESNYSKCKLDAKNIFFRYLDELGVVGSAGIILTLGLIFACFTSKNIWVCAATLGIGMVDFIFIFAAREIYERDLAICESQRKTCEQKCDRMACV